MQVVLPDGRAYERQGVVEYVENMANRRTDTSSVYIRLPNPDGHLRPDGTVTVRLASARGTARLAVPVTAVLQNVQGPYVWVVGADGKAERRQVGRGRIDGPWRIQIDYSWKAAINGIIMPFSPWGNSALKRKAR